MNRPFLPDSEQPEEAGSQPSWSWLASGKAFHQAVCCQLSACSSRLESALSTESALLKMLKTRHPEAPDPRLLEAKVPALLAQLESYLQEGFKDTRVSSAEPDFIQDVLKPVEQIALTHCCVVLGPAGAGKTTLVNHLCGSHFHTGPRAEDKTIQAQSCVLKLKNLPDQMKVLKVVLIDTPGWSHETSTDIKMEYKKVLKEYELVSEHTPHIILFCVSVSNIRQFQEKEAKKMSEQLEELKFDQRFPVKVLPVATFSDTQDPKDLEKLMSTIKALAKKAFQNTGAEVEEPEWTMFNAHEEARGVYELKARISDMLFQQVQSSQFSDLWKKTFAKSVAERAEEHCNSVPENESPLRLFHSAFRTVAAACDMMILDVGDFKRKTTTMQDLPWDIIQSIPHTGEQMWPVELCVGVLGIFLVLIAWFCGFNAIALLALPPSLCMICWSKYAWYKCTHWWRLLRLWKIPVEWKSSSLPHCMRRCKHSRIRYKWATGILGFMFVVLFWEGRTWHQEDEGTCSWGTLHDQCMGLEHLVTASSAVLCKRVCCDLGEDHCTVWQYDEDSGGCWLGKPHDDCHGSGWFAHGGRRM
ncbi:Putative E3 ubiquitin-protein ligase HERC1 [Durusdinium trenchii]|uniref:E3 ubiquitin-protein ligase HERC1 n=1 Tax=Durusdinium trenchii TaxID=1381693 RepID=A0ABP0N0S3_9DINO